VISALVIGTVLSLGALAFVLYPLFFGAPHADWSAPRASQQHADSAAGDEESAVAALRELEFDRATGKLSDTDYAELKARYTKSAVAAMRRESRSDTPATRPSDDDIEAEVRVYRQRLAGCPTCGPRPEPDAVYCSNCGRYIHDRCANCGAPVVALEARYCNNCGNRLAA
jgi:hypothetical protein